MKKKRKYIYLEKCLIIRILQIYIFSFYDFLFFISLSGVEKYFFHVNNIIGSIAENSIVTFDLERGVKGMNAVNICLENGPEVKEPVRDGLV